MRAVRLPAPGHRVEDAEVPMPSCGPGDVLVRVRAAGICHSDVHYRAGRSRVDPLPLTLGHEIAGEIVEVGQHALHHSVGDSVCLHYLITCGQCDDCLAGREQFCATGKMLGHFTDGGWAEYIAVPARNAVPLPPSVLRKCTRASARSLETQQRRVLRVLRVLRNARSLETQQRRVVIFSPTRVLEMYLDLHSVSFYAAPAQRSFATECGADAHTLVHVTRTLHAPTHGPSIRTRTRRTGIQ